MISMSTLLLSLTALHFSVDEAPGVSRSQTTDSAQVAAVVEAFHDALEAGDGAVAQSLLAPDLTVLESGSMEDRAHYIEHHLPADMSYLASVDGERGEISVTVAGDVAWTHSVSRTESQTDDETIRRASAELMVLRRSDDSWLIVAIHWSSRRVRN